MSERGELAGLAAALSGHLRRAERRGLRRVAVPAREARSEEAPPVEAPPTPPRQGVRTPETAPQGAPQTASSPSQPPTTPLGPDPTGPAAAACGDLETLRTKVAECTACGLCRTRTQTVFSDGDGSAGVLFVGEAPGADEDRTGVPFVGRAGQLLTDIITKGMGLERRSVYIANVLKCRPPENRDPSPEEKRLCTAFLDRQIELLAPKVIVALGRHAAGHLLSSDASMGRMRGRVHQRKGRPVVATYHPAFLLRSPHMKKECWQDIQLAMAELGLRPPGR